MNPVLARRATELFRPPEPCLKIVRGPRHAAPRSTGEILFMTERRCSQSDRLISGAACWVTVIYFLGASPKPFSMLQNRRASIRACVRYCWLLRHLWPSAAATSPIPVIPTGSFGSRIWLYLIVGAYIQFWFDLCNRINDPSGCPCVNFPRCQLTGKACVEDKQITFADWEKPMIKTTTTSFVAAAVMAMTGQAALADAHGELTVAYFLEWPMPFMVAKNSGAYDEALGMTVNWVSFDTGTAMSAAMASGDVQIAVSQGVPPFVVATSGGQDLQTIDVAVSYSENDNCVVASSLEIDKDSAGELAGKKVAVPLGTAAHYGFLRQMEHFGVPLDSLTVVDMAPAEGAAALSQGQVDFACGWGGALDRMKEYGNTLLTGAEKEELGILVFDVTSAPASFVAENPDVVAKFLAVTAEANEAWKTNPTDEMLAIIAEESGMDIDATKASLDTFTFPSIDEQLSASWLGGNAASFMKGVADVFVEAGSIDGALDSYEGAVNVGPLQAASEM